MRSGYAQPGGASPGTLPQVAFSGRSNVGKSSLINTLLQRTRSKIAHVSGKPGKTRALNFYRVNDDFFLVDPVFRLPQLFVFATFTVHYKRLQISLFPI